MGDVVEEIIAEPEESGWLSTLFFAVHTFVSANGWYILTAAVALYFLWKNKIAPAISSAQSQTAKSPAELKSWQAKEEQRLQAIQRLQQKYEQDAAVKAEKQKLLDEQKKQARLAELEALTKGQQKLGSKASTSFKPEYNPLMGNTSSSERVCFRRPGGGSGGG